MKITTKIKRWFRNLFEKKDKRHFFDNSDEIGYLPCLPVNSRDKAVYGKSKLAGNSEAFMRGRFKSGNKKGKKP